MTSEEEDNFRKTHTQNVCNNCGREREDHSALHYWCHAGHPGGGNYQWLNTWYEAPEDEEVEDDDIPF